MITLASADMSAQQLAQTLHYNCYEPVFWWPDEQRPHNATRDEYVRATTWNGDRVEAWYRDGTFARATYANEGDGQPLEFTGLAALVNLLCLEQYEGEDDPYDAEIISTWPLHAANSAQEDLV